MALGKPSISDVRTLDVRALATTISNIRQRFEALEGALNTASATSSAQGTANFTQFGILRQLIAQLQTQIDALGSLGAVDDANLVLAQRSFNPVPPPAATAPAVVVDDASLVLSQRTFNPGPPSAPPTSTPLAADDASMVLAQRSFSPPITPPLVASVTDVLQTQVFGA